MPEILGFKPSTSGFHFSNSAFPAVPLLTIHVLGLDIPIGDASNGLCGGMVFAVRDYFESHTPVPADTTAPSSGPLFDFLVQCLMVSFNLPEGPLIYMALMDPALPDHETWMSKHGLAPRGRAWMMIESEWPKIKAELDSGHLSPMALIRIKSLDPFMLKENHQVLAYGYNLNGSDLTIQVYDPNYPGIDDISLKLSIAKPENTTSVSYSAGGDPVWCFFHINYTLPSPVTGPGAPTNEPDPICHGLRQRLQTIRDGIDVVTEELGDPSKSPQEKRTLGMRLTRLRWNEDRTLKDMDANGCSAI